jgi:hypothetical protein
VETDLGMAMDVTSQSLEIWAHVPPPGCLSQLHPRTNFGTMTRCRYLAPLEALVWSSRTDADDEWDVAYDYGETERFLPIISEAF